SGGSGIIGGMVVGATMTGTKAITFSTAALITLAMRGSTKLGGNPWGSAAFLMSNRQLTRMTRIMSDSTTDKLRRVLLVKLLKSIGEKDETPQVLN
ncbi:hypothetical protein LCGC14_2985300, partial [marine sediment metagenome]